MPDLDANTQQGSLLSALSSTAGTETTLTSESQAREADPARQQAEGQEAAAPSAHDEPQAQEQGAAPEDTRFDKHPRWQEMRSKTEAAEARVAELEAQRQPFEQDKNLYDQARTRGFSSIGEMLTADARAWEQQQAEEQAQREAQAAMEGRAAELREQVTQGYMTEEAANRLYRAEMLLEQGQRQQQQTTLLLGRQALAEAESMVPTLKGHKDLYGVLQQSLNNPDAIRTVGREMKAFGDAREQAGYDRAKAEMAQAPDRKTPAPLSAEQETYAPPGSGNPEKKWSLKGALMAR